MDPFTIALIVASLGEAAKFTIKLVELIQRANAGEIDSETALEELRKAQAEYDAARQGWDQAGSPIE
jgi:hypothetical protein